MCNARCIKTKQTWGEASEALERALKRQRTTSTATTFNSSNSTNVVGMKATDDAAGIISSTSSCDPTTTRTTMGLMDLFDAIELDRSPFPSIALAFDSDDSELDTITEMQRTAPLAKVLSSRFGGAGMVRSKSIKTDLFSLSSSHDIKPHGLLQIPIVNTFDILTEASEITEMDDLFT